MLRDPTPLRFGDDVPAGSIQAGHVNCINYDDYAWSPILAVESFNNNASGVGELGSVESTHGLIRLVSAAPFLYVSGIAATVGLLNDHVTPRVYAQNTVAAHNAAIALTAGLLSLIPLGLALTGLLRRRVPART